MVRSASGRSFAPRPTDIRFRSDRRRPTPACLTSTPIPYDPLKDLAPVSIVGRSPYVFAVSPSLGVKSITRACGAGQVEAGQLNYSSIGEGSIVSLGWWILARRWAFELQHIPYKSTAQSIVDVSTGIIQMQLATVAPDACRCLTRRKSRSWDRGQVPTASLSGCSRPWRGGDPRYEHTFWVALFAPAGTPEAIIARSIVRSQSAGDGYGEQAFNAQGVETEHSGPRASSNPSAGH